MKVLEETPLSANPGVMRRFGESNKRCGHSYQDSCQCYQPYPFVLPYGPTWPSSYGTAWGSQCGNQQYDDSASAEKIKINYIKNTNIDNGGLQISNQNINSEFGRKLQGNKNGYFTNPTIADLFNPERVDNPIIQTFNKIGGKLAQDITQQLLNQQSLLYSAPNDDLNSSIHQPSSIDLENDGVDEYDSRPSIKQTLADLFHPKNPKNPIVRAFDKTGTKFIASIKKVLGIKSDNPSSKSETNNEDDENNQKDQEEVNKNDNDTVNDDNPVNDDNTVNDQDDIKNNDAVENQNDSVNKVNANDNNTGNNQKIEENQNDQNDIENHEKINNHQVVNDQDDTNNNNAVNDQNDQNVNTNANVNNDDIANDKVTPYDQDDVIDQDNSKNQSNVNNQNDVANSDKLNSDDIVSYKADANDDNDDNDDANQKGKSKKDNKKNKYDQNIIEDSKNKNNQDNVNGDIYNEESVNNQADINHNNAVNQKDVNYQDNKEDKSDTNNPHNEDSINNDNNVNNQDNVNNDDVAINKSTKNDKITDDDQDDAVIDPNKTKIQDNKSNQDNAKAQFKSNDDSVNSHPNINSEDNAVNKKNVNNQNDKDNLRDNSNANDQDYKNNDNNANVDDQDSDNDVKNQDVNNHEDQVKKNETHQDNVNTKNTQIDIDNQNKVNAQDNSNDKPNSEDLTYKKKFTLSELFQPDNVNNPILRTFENIKSKFIDTIINKLSATNSISRKNNMINIAQLLHPDNPENPVLRTFENLGKNIARVYSETTNVNQNDITKDKPFTLDSNSKDDDQYNSKKQKQPNGTDVLKNQLEQLNSNNNPTITDAPANDAKFELEFNQKPQSKKANDDSIRTFSYNPIAQQSIYNPTPASLVQPFLKNNPSIQILPSLSNLVHGSRIVPNQRKVNVLCLPVRRQQTVKVENPFNTNIFNNLDYNNYDNSQVRVVNPWTNLN